VRVLKLQGKGYRNLKPFELIPQEGVNVIWGNNAQGKTNLLEALWLFTGSKSFRGSKEQEILAIGEAFTSIKLDFFAREREQSAEIKLEKKNSEMTQEARKNIFTDSLPHGVKRENKLNGVDKKSSAALMGEFCAVVFSPDTLSLIKEGPSERRKFIDAAICQVKPLHTKVFLRYHKALKQRNTILKDIKMSTSLYSLLDVWDEELAKLGAQMIFNRLEYLQRLTKSAKEIYQGISSGKEEISLKYSLKTTNFNMQISEIYDIIIKELTVARKEDVKAGFSTFGPHRDDIEISINELPARTYGSQGQQRSCVLALKLAEAELLNEVTGEKPIALLDDVMSELDTERQDYILNKLTGSQVFISCCDPAPLLRLTEGKTFYLKGGEIS
jgi:DNA replication and repair protein RecF